MTSSSTTRRLLVLIGSGPGIGVATASLFASKGFSVALLSRNAERLQEDAIKVRSAAASSSATAAAAAVAAAEKEEDDDDVGSSPPSSAEVQVETFPVDVSDPAAFKTALEAVHAALGPPEVVVYNAARVGPSRFGYGEGEGGGFTPDELLDDFRVNGVGLYVAAVWAMPYLVELAATASASTSVSGRHRRKQCPSFLLSGSGIHGRPLPALFSLSMQKAAQTNFLQSLDQLFGGSGVHVARLDINGLVREDDDTLSPRRCAEEHWRLSQQADRDDWEHVVEIGDMDVLVRALKEAQEGAA